MRGAIQGRGRLARLAFSGLLALLPGGALWSPAAEPEDDEGSVYAQVQALSRRGAPFESFARLLPRCAADADADADAGATGGGAEPAGQDRAIDCSRLFAALGERADTAGQNQLWRFYDHLPPGDDLRAKLVEALLEARFRRTLRELEPAPASLREGAGPEDERGALERGREQHASLEQGYRELFQEAQRLETVEVQSHWGEFYASLADFLRERSTAAQAISRLARFQWGGFCGTGAHRLSQPQDRALLLALVAEGRQQLAAGAALAIFTRFGGLGAFGGRSFGEPPPRWTGALRAAGVDDEAVLAAAAAAGSEQAADLLASQGSTRAARLLLTAVEETPARRPLNEWERTRSLPDVAALVAPGRSCGAAPDRGELLESIPTRAGRPLPAAVQQRALDLLARSVGPEAGLAEASQAAHLLLQLCRRESLPTYRGMLSSPFGRVRERAAQALRAWKQRDVEFRPNPPVVVRVVVDGRPWTRQPVAWSARLRHGEGDEHLVSVTSRATRTDAQGLLRLDRDEFADPRWPAARVELRSTEEAQDGPRFLADGALPADPDEPVVVEIRTQSLQADLPLAVGRLRVSLQPVPDVDGDAAPGVPGSFEAEGGQRLVIPRLQRGRYTLAASSSETPPRMWLAGPIELGEEPQVVKAWRQR